MDIYVVIQGSHRKWIDACTDDGSLARLIKQYVQLKYRTRRRGIFGFSKRPLDSAFVRNVSCLSPTTIFQDAELCKKKLTKMLTILVDERIHIIAMILLGNTHLLLLVGINITHLFLQNEVTHNSGKFSTYIAAHP